MKYVVAYIAMFSSTAVMAQNTSPAVPDTFYGSGTPGYFGTTRHFSAQSATAFEAGQQIVVESNVGSGNPISAGKIGSFIAAIGHPGSAAVYAENLLAGVDAGAGDIIVTGSEINVNNNNKDYGESSISQTLGVGLLLNSGGPKRLSAALAIRGTSVSTGSPIWNRGIAFYDDSINKVTIEDSTNAPTVLKVSGNHVVGLDLAAATGMVTAMGIPNNTAIAALNAAGTGAYEVIKASPTNGVTVGGGSTGVSVPTALAVTGSVQMTGLPVYADNSAASAGGLSAGTVYRTGTGQLMVVY